MFKKFIEKELHKDLIRAGSFLLFFGLFMQYAQESSPKQCVVIGIILLFTGGLTTLLSKNFKKTLMIIGLLGIGILTNKSYATTLTEPYCSESTGGYVFASHWNANCSATQTWANNQNIDGTTNIATGGIQTSNIANLAVTDAKIAGITTAGKVNGSALTALNNVPSGAGQIPAVNLGSGSATTATFLRGDGSWNNPFLNYVKVSEVETQNTSGSAPSTVAFTAVVLNTKDSDPGNIATLNSNQVTLPSGTYIADVAVPIYDGGICQSRLYNVTGSAVLLVGQSVQIGTVSSTTVPNIIKGEFTLAGSTAIDVQTYCSHAGSIGIASNYGSEVYTVATFQKVS